ncbi:MAG TPA: aldo/keto reductase, partial [bacterium]|nr:aldo/keto reductase [bacterium]
MMDFTKPNPNLYGIPWSTDSFNEMPYRKLGTSGFRVPNIGLGTWKIGYPETGDGSRTDERTALQILDRSVEIGVTLWDTANRYNDSSGNSERIIGTWFANNPDQRRNIVVATKVFGGMDGITPNHSRLSRSNILESLYACLKRLRLEYVDILYFHAYDPDTPLDESLTAVEDLVQRDMVRYFAVSNFSTQQLKDAMHVASRLSSRCRIQAVQNRLDILDGEKKEHEGVLQLCAEAGVSFVPYSPLALGLLTEKYLDISKVGKGDRLYDEDALSKVASKARLNKVRQLASLAHGLGLRLNELSLVYMLT